MSLLPLVLLWFGGLVLYGQRVSDAARPVLTGVSALMVLLLVVEKCMARPAAHTWCSTRAALVACRVPPSVLDFAERTWTGAANIALVIFLLLLGTGAVLLYNQPPSAMAMVESRSAADGPELEQALAPRVSSAPVGSMSERTLRDLLELGSPLPRTTSGSNTQEMVEPVFLEPTRSPREEPSSAPTTQLAREEFESAAMDLFGAVAFYLRGDVVPTESTFEALSPYAEAVFIRLGISLGAKTVGEYRAMTDKIRPLLERVAIEQEILRQLAEGGSTRMPMHSIYAEIDKRLGPNLLRSTIRLLQLEGKIPTASRPSGAAQSTDA